MESLKKIGETDLIVRQLNLYKNTLKYYSDLYGYANFYFYFNSLFLSAAIKYNIGYAVQRTRLRDWQYLESNNHKNLRIQNIKLTNEIINQNKAYNKEYYNYIKSSGYDINYEDYNIIPQAKNTIDINYLNTLGIIKPNTL